MVEQVDFISAPGTSPPEILRPGGPVALVTGLCRFDFDRARGGFTLASIHPGHDLEEVRDCTGFDFDRPAEVPVDGGADAGDAAPDAQRRRSAMLAEVYPQFAKNVFGATA